MQMRSFIWNHELKRFAQRKNCLPISNRFCCRIYSRLRIDQLNTKQQSFINTKFYWFESGNSSGLEVKQGIDKLVKPSCKWIRMHLDKYIFDHFYQKLFTIQVSGRPSILNIRIPSSGNNMSFCFVLVLIGKLMKGWKGIQETWWISQTILHLNTDPPLYINLSDIM
jgi:hypothetical protein